MTDQSPKAKGIVDIVFLIDVTGSMQPCIDALKKNIATFVDALTTGDANNSSPVRDWRASIVGYRDVTDGDKWIEVNPFVRDPSILKQHLSTLVAEGGGDEPESLLDALYKVATMPEAEKGDTNNDPPGWRYRSAAARVIVIFTDASFKEPIDIPEARGGTLDDITNLITSKRIILSIFAPDMPCYDRLSAIDKSEWEPIAYDKSDKNGAVRALADFTSNQEHFKNTLRQLAASVSKSAETPSLA